MIVITIIDLNKFKIHESGTLGGPSIAILNFNGEFAYHYGKALSKKLIIVLT